MPDLGEDGGDGFDETVLDLTDGNGGEIAVDLAEGGGDAVVDVGVDAQALVGIVVVGDQAVVLHEDDGGTAAGFLLDAGEFIADGEGEACAGIDVGHEAPGVVRAGKGFGDDFAAILGTGGEVGVDAVAVGDIGVQQRMEARLDRGTQLSHALYGLDGGPRLFAAGLLHVFKVGHFAAKVEGAQGVAVQHGICLVHLNVLQAVAGGLDGHQTALELDGGVAAAALNVVCAGADGTGNAGKRLEAFAVGIKKSCHNGNLLV